MPTYEYECTVCGQHIEVFQRFSEDPLTACGVCGGKLRKVFHPAGIVFKGSGFYATDSRSKASSGGSTTKDPDGVSSSSKGSSSSDSPGSSDSSGSEAGSGSKGGDGGSSSKGSNGGSSSTTKKEPTPQ